MLIRVCVKHAGNLTKKVKEIPFYLEDQPCTLRQLVEYSVRTCVISFRERGVINELPLHLTDSQMESMREVGKFAFGVHYNQKDVDIDKATENAICAVTDGLVRIFKGQTELCDLDERIEINEGDVFTFVKLTMLSGRLW